jgi:hypothetical protein
MIYARKTLVSLRFPRPAPITHYSSGVTIPNPDRSLKVQHTDFGALFVSWRRSSVCREPRCDVAPLSASCASATRCQKACELSPRRPRWPSQHDEGINHE